MISANAHLTHIATTCFGVIYAVFMELYIEIKNLL